MNPEDEDDVVPDQHAAFGIKAATSAKREAVWKDLRLEELVRGGPEDEGVRNVGEVLRVRRAGGAVGGSVGGGLRS